MTQPSSDSTGTPVRRWRRRLLVGTAAASLTGGLVASQLVRAEPAAADPGLTPFHSCAEVAAWYRNALQGRVGPSGIQPPEQPWWRSVFGGNASSAVGSSEGATPSAASAPQDAVGVGQTGTNVQEAGVDEPDTVKVQGTVMVTVAGGRLVVVDMSGDTPRQLGGLRLPLPQDAVFPGKGGVSQTEILLEGNRILVSAPGYDRTLDHSTTRLVLVDISDRAHPRLVKAVEIEGWYLTARQADGRVRLVLSTPPALPFTRPQLITANVHSDAELRAASQKAQQANQRLVDRATGADYLPHLLTRDGNGQVTSRTPLLGCTDLYRPTKESGFNTISVSTLDLQSDSPLVQTTGVLADGAQVYASRSTLFVATTAFGQVSNATGMHTQLHSFDTTAADRSRYQASGEVDGWLLGRWAMSEQQGLLRVATTRQAGGSTDSAVTLLKATGGKLTQVGTVAGMGKGEQIRSVRWFGTTAIVVTFRQTDPLYVVDLSDPKSPKVSGELKVPGYSAYLHPIGNGQLLGVGQSATNAGVTTGTQVSTFDISHPTEPTRIDVASQRNSDSGVEWDSRAFSYLPNRRIALIPINSNDGTTSLRAVRVGIDGRLAQAGQWSPDSATDAGGLTRPENQGMLTRAMAVGQDRVVALANTMDGVTTATLLTLDSLTPSPSLSLG